MSARPGRFTGKSVLVTGAATGIGWATARYFAEEGSQVLGVGLDAGEGRRVFSEAAEQGLSVSFLETDVTREADVRAAAAAAQDRFGRLDAVVNCAGIYPTGKRLEDLSDLEWGRTIDVNLTSVFRVCRATIPLMRASGGGAIVNIASVHALSTVPGVPAYAATKAAVLGLSRQMSLDYAVDRIRVNAVLVGSVATRMTLESLPAAGPESIGLSFERNRAPRIADPREIATAIGFLVSDDASFVTGSGFLVDGGLTALVL